MGEFSLGCVGDLRSMTRATSGRRVVTRTRQKPPFKTAPFLGRIAGSLGRGAATLALAFSVVACVLTAAGWVFSIASDARTERRSTIGLPQQSQFAWLSIPASAIASTVPYVTRNWPEDETTADTTGSVTPNSATPQSIALPSSGLLGASTTDPLFFSAGSQHNAQFEQRFAAVTDRFESRPFIAPGNYERTVRPKDAPPMIIPRARKQLASLPPATGIVIPEDDPQLQKTAIYDINAKAVYMPNGEKLEAHSGLGQHMDDPKHYKLRMRGVTPPNSYKLTMREARFHGVEAIRMNPENIAAMNGRAGILVHPYMLGPNGQSNGCVSVKDYPKFLAAFKRGEVNRMVVVFRLPEPPAAYARRNIGKTRTAKAL
jgi:hypothetical protein